MKINPSVEVLVGFRVTDFMKITTVLFACGFILGILFHHEGWFHIFLGQGDGGINELKATAAQPPKLDRENGIVTLSIGTLVGTDSYFNKVFTYGGSLKKYDVLGLSFDEKMEVNREWLKFKKKVNLALDRSDLRITNLNGENFVHYTCTLEKHLAKELINEFEIALASTFPENSAARIAAVLKPATNVCTLGVGLGKKDVWITKKAGFFYRKNIFYIDDNPVFQDGFAGEDPGSQFEHIAGREMGVDFRDKLISSVKLLEQ